MFATLALLGAILGSSPASAALSDEYQPGTCITNTIQSTPFVDVAQSTYYTNAVGWAYLNDITTGTDATHFSPGDTVTRAQFATFLHRMMCEPTPAGVAPFLDLIAGAYYRTAVDWLWGASLTTGKTATEYGPNDGLTRGQFAAFLYRLVGEPTGAPASGFVDVVSWAYFADAVDWLFWRELTTGTSATTFSPDRIITRAEAVTFLYRLNIYSRGLIDPADLSLGFSQVLTGLSQPVDATAHPTDGSIYIVQQGGVVLRVPGKGDGTPDWAAGATQVLDISASVISGGERGLLGVAISPDGSKIYLSFTEDASGGDSVIWEYTLAGGVPTGAPDEVIRVSQPHSNHNGGNVVFGPDGYLYTSFGDGGSGGDPHEHGQNTSTLLGAILRIDPTTGSGYTSPSSNPFVGTSGSDEIYLYGVRNPWRFSFDRDTGDLWVADVGQNKLEEINRLKATSGAGLGANLGWNTYEGTQRYDTGDPDILNHVAPVYEYAHGAEGYSVTGGYVYRGLEIVGLSGTYLWADYGVPSLRGFNDTFGSGPIDYGVDAPGGAVAGFLEDGVGEVYAISRSGTISKIVEVGG